MFDGALKIDSRSEIAFLGFEGAGLLFLWLGAADCTQTGQEQPHRVHRHGTGVCMY